MVKYGFCNDDGSCCYILADCDGFDFLSDYICDANKGYDYDGEMFLDVPTCDVDGEECYYLDDSCVDDYGVFVEALKKDGKFVKNISESVYDDDYEEPNTSPDIDESFNCSDTFEVDSVYQLSEQLRDAKLEFYKLQKSNMSDKELIEAHEKISALENKLRTYTNKENEAYEYSKWDKDQLQKKAQSLAKTISDLYYNAISDDDASEDGLGSVNEITSDLMENPRKVDAYIAFLSKLYKTNEKNKVGSKIKEIVNNLTGFKKKLAVMKPKVERVVKKSASPVNEDRQLARRLFLSLVEDAGEYLILNDGYFVTRVIADNDDEAIQVFDNFVKTDWKDEWNAGAYPRVISLDTLEESLIEHDDSFEGFNL